MRQFIERHNRLCERLRDYNRFSSYLVLNQLMCVIPLNLICWHQLLFERLSLKIKIIYFIANISWVSYTLGFIFFSALLSLRLHSMCKRLAQIQWQLSGWIVRLRMKLKIMTYFERLSSDRKLGLTMGPFGAATIRAFYMVIYLLCYLDLIISNFKPFTDCGEIYPIFYINS
jgi:hypothetical protein